MAKKIAPIAPAYQIIFKDLGKSDALGFAAAKNRAQGLLTAFERRKRLSENEVNQLKDALELLGQYKRNGHPTASLPKHADAMKKLGIVLTSKTAGVIDDTYRAIAELLDIKVEHVDGQFPSQKPLKKAAAAAAAAGWPPLTLDEFRIAAVWGIVSVAGTVPPQYKTIPSLKSPEDDARSEKFSDAVSKADSQIRSNSDLFVKVQYYLVTVGRGGIDAIDWAKVVDILVKQKADPNDGQIDVKIQRALDAAQNVGPDRPPSMIDIDLPDLEQEVSDFEIVKENIFALQPAYFAAMFEELKVFMVVDKLSELFQNGILPVGKGDAGNLLFKYWKSAALRVSEAERRNFYARTLGVPGGDDGGSPNREFNELFMRFVSAVSSFVRQTQLDNMLRSNIPGAVSQQQVRKSGRDLATNISAHGYGMAYPMATELQTQINDTIAILKNAEIRAAYGARDMWQVVDQVSALELGGARNSVKYRTMASAGAVVFAWLANNATRLASGSYSPILDVALLQDPPFQTTKPTKEPSDYDLVAACDQWLAVTGTQEESVEKMAEANESPVMPSRPIQIPGIAREMLESVGVPAMSHGAGKPNGVGYRR